MIEEKKVLGWEKKSSPPFKGLVTSNKYELIIQYSLIEKIRTSAEGARNFLSSFTSLELYFCKIAPFPGEKCLKSMLNY